MIPTLGSRKPTPSAERFNQFTEGDLHGNTMRLIETLVYHGIIEMTSEEYREVFRAYEICLQEPSNIGMASLLCQKLSNVVIKDKKKLVRLIGDVLADRVGNDRFNLTLISHLTRSGCNVRVLMSNHDISFMLAVMKAKNANELFNSSRDEFFSKHNQGQSFINLAQAVRNGNPSFESVKAMAKDYFSTLVLLDYSLDESSGQLKIYSHAPVNLNDLRNLGTEFGVPYPGDDCSHAERIQFITGVNQVFRALVSSEQTETLERLFSGKNPANEVLWRRERGHLFIDRGKKITNVYGHDKDNDVNVTADVIQLDNSSGKSGLNATSENTSHACQERYSFLSAYAYKGDEKFLVDNLTEEAIAARHILSITDVYQMQRFVNGLDDADKHRPLYRQLLSDLSNNPAILQERMTLLKKAFGDLPELPLIAVGLADEALLNKLVLKAGDLDEISMALKGWGRDTRISNFIGTLVQQEREKREGASLKSPGELTPKDFLNALGLKPIPVFKILINGVENPESRQLLHGCYRSSFQEMNALVAQHVTTENPLIKSVMAKLIEIRKDEVKSLLTALGVKKIPIKKILLDDLSNNPKIDALDFNVSADQLSKLSDDYKESKDPLVAQILLLAQEKQQTKAHQNDLKTELSHLKEEGVRKSSPTPVLPDSSPRGSLK